MQRPIRITMEESLAVQPDKSGWRPMTCAPRISADDEDVQPIVLARTEDDQDIEVVWNPDKNIWTSKHSGTAFAGRLLAWRPVEFFAQPEKATMALSLAEDCEIQALKHDRMAPFLPPEKEKAQRLRANRDKYLAIANKSR